MIASRVVLHLAALILPLGVFVAVISWLGGANFRGALPFAAAAVLAAQIAALFGGVLLQRPSQYRWLVPIAIGFGMALATYLLFGPLLWLVMLVLSDHSSRESLRDLLEISFASALITGWAAAPLTIAVSILVDRLRRKELHRAVV